MRTIQVFICLVSTFVLFASPRIQGDTSLKPETRSAYTFSVAALAGFLYGQGEEIVYINDTDTYLSQLLWDMKPLFYAGSSLDFSPVNPLEGLGFFTHLSLKFGIPGKTGTMEDRDWLNKENGLNDNLTNFSSHDNYTQGAFLLDSSIGISLPLASWFLLKGYVDFSYMYFSWASQDGFTQYAARDSSTGGYAPWEDTLPKTAYYGPAINYQQRWVIFTPGLAVHIPFLYGLSLGAYLHISPFIHCVAVDDHIRRGIQFRDDTSGGLLFESQGAITFAPNPRLELSLSLGYRSIQGLQGPTTSRNTGTTSGLVSQSGTGGAGYAVLDTGLSIKIRW
ncbi:MAG: omptin family outer membrane protease [Treponema sp.]|jgi:outer membrane protease|nr:omptin family outer membrane protease [Treponema sp.]